MERYLARVAFLALKIWNFILFILTRIKYFSRKKRPKDTSVSNPAITDLIEIWPKTIDQQDYAKQIFTQIEKARNTAREKAKAWNKNNITYRNQKRQDKKFLPGQIVLHRQLQVSTGSGGALKPLFTGPYIGKGDDLLIILV